MQRTLSVCLVLLLFAHCAQAQQPPHPEKIEAWRAQFEGADQQCGQHALHRHAAEKSHIGTTPSPAPGLPREESATAAALAAVGSGQKALPTSTAEWAALSQVDLILNIKASDYNDLRVLFFFDQYVEQVITSSNVTAAMAEALLLSTNVAVNAQAIEQLLLFVQIAYYNAFYQPSIILDANTLQACIDVLEAVSASPDFLAPGDALLQLRAQWSVTIDNTDSSIEYVDVIEALFARYNANPLLAEDHYERSTIYNLCFTLQRQVGNNSNQGAGSIWYNAIPDSLVQAMGQLAMRVGYDAREEYVLNNVLWALGHFSYLAPATSALAHEKVSDTYNNFGQTQAPWVWSVRVLDYFFGSKTSANVTLDIPAIKAQLTALIFPDTYTFDDGALICRTGIAPSKVNLLYDALQEVESQFFRLTGQITPVLGDQNPVLTAFVYATPRDYELYQPLLFETSTNNGGIYIEQRGEFYTYDRTSAQSAYTLEDLFRHEYVHYLDGRYQIQEEFGDPGSLYPGERLTWYQEGLAELVAGATRVKDILPRRVLVELVAGDGGDRMTVNEIVGASYNSGFQFYRYSCLLLLHMLEEHHTRLIGLLEAVRGNNPATVDALWAGLKADAALQTTFDAFLDAHVDALVGGMQFKEDIPTARRPSVLPANNEAELFAAITALSPSIAPTAAIIQPGRYRFQDSFTVSVAADPQTSPHLVRAALNNAMNGRLHALALGIDNFLSATAWYGEIQYTANNATATYFIEAPYCTADCDATVRRVDALNVSGVEDGLTWATAFSTVQAGIDAVYANGGGEVWIARGTYSEARSYTPAGQSEDTGALLLREGVSLYGGFRGLSPFGNEAQRDQRTIFLNMAVIDGATARGGQPAFHVVYAENNAVIDNVVIRGGNADGQDNNSKGGGILILDASPIVRNCVVTENKSSYAGAGIYVESGNPVLDNLYLTSNECTSYGGGMYIYNAQPNVRNVVFHKNKAYTGGAAECYAGASAKFINCTFFNNTASLGAIYLSAGSPALFVNSILWNPSSDEFYIQNVESDPTLTHCNVRGGFVGTGNFSLDPHFVNPALGDVRLNALSPCVDTGTTHPNAPNVDIAGVSRPQGAAYDIGAVEFPSGAAEGEGEVEGYVEDGFLHADPDHNFQIDLTELLRVIQFYNSGGLHCAVGTEDGFAPGPVGSKVCEPYDSDYDPQDWIISLSELLRVIQIYNSNGYHYCPADGTEDGFCPGL